MAAGEASAPSPGDLTPLPGASARAGASGPGAPAEPGAPPEADALPVAGAVPARKIPDRLPSFSLGDRDGKPTSIAAFAGKSLVINFWATWCAPCRREIPLLETLNAEWAARGVRVIGVAVDHRDKVLEFAERFKIGYPLLIGDQDALGAATAFGVETPVFPFTVFTDRGGDVVAVFLGELHRPQADLILKTVQDLDGGRVLLPAARESLEEALRALPDAHPAEPGGTNDAPSATTDARGAANT